MKKYELTDNTLTWCDGSILHRIKALKDVPGAVSKGELGGWIESEDNLSHEGNCWVANDAVVRGRARVYGNARVAGLAVVSGAAKVCENAKVFNYARVSGCAEVSGYALVSGHAKISGNGTTRGTAIIRGYAMVSGYAVLQGSIEVSGNAILLDGCLGKHQDYACFGPIGSRNDFITLNKTTGTVCTGCFRGTLDEFKKAVEKTHGDNEHGIAYKKLIAYFRNL